MTNTNDPNAVEVNKPSITTVLQQLRRVLLAVPDERLRMRSLVEEAECGTTCCLLGWAVVDPWFRANSLSAMPLFNTHALREQFIIAGLSRDNCNRLFGIYLDGGLAPEAVTKFEVRWNIEELLAGRDARPYAATSQRKISPPSGPFAADRDPATLPATNDMCLQRQASPDHYDNPDFLAAMASVIAS